MSASAEKPRYHRVLVKFSGEALMGQTSFGIDPAVLARLVSEIHELVLMDVQIGIVIGGGNFFRGAALSAAGMGRAVADQMGLLATVMNALAFQDAMEKVGIANRIMSAVPVTGIADAFDRKRTLQLLEDHHVVLYAAGTGHPFFTTDSAASLRALEIQAQALLKATKVDGVYSEDPVGKPQAICYKSLTFDDVLKRNLRVMDATAVCMCREHNLPIHVFNMNKPQALKRVVMGKEEGTLIS